MEKKECKRIYSHARSGSGCMSHFTFECVLYFVDYGSIDQYVSCHISHILMLSHIFCTVFPIAKLTFSSLLLPLQWFPHSFPQWHGMSSSSPVSAKPNQAWRCHPLTRLAHNCRLLNIAEEGVERNKYKIRLMVLAVHCVPCVCVCVCTAIYGFVQSSFTYSYKVSHEIQPIAYTRCSTIFSSSPAASSMPHNNNTS